MVHCNDIKNHPFNFFYNVIAKHRSETREEKEKCSPVEQIYYFVKGDDEGERRFNRERKKYGTPLSRNEKCENKEIRK